MVAGAGDGEAHLQGPVLDEELEEVFEGGGGVFGVDAVGDEVAVVTDGDDLAGEEAAVGVAGVDGAFVDIEEDGDGVGAVAGAGGEATAGVSAEAEEFEGIGFGFEGDVADARDGEGDAERVEPGLEGEIGTGGEPGFVCRVGGAGVGTFAMGVEETEEGAAGVARKWRRVSIARFVRQRVCTVRRSGRPDWTTGRCRVPLRRRRCRSI